MGHTRTASRIVTNALPAWVSAVAATNTLYPIGQVTSVLDSLITWPGGTAIPNMDGGGDATPAQQHRGWGGSWYVEDVGAHGAFVFGRTGEFTMENQRTALMISDDAAPWAMWDQPQVARTSSEAVSMDADYYYNAADYAAIQAARGHAGIIYGNTPGSPNTATWADSVWDGAFPVGLPLNPQTGWIQRRKLTGNNFGNGAVARYRYNYNVYIPAGWTGTGAGALITNPWNFGGPYQSGYQNPVNLTDLSRWYAEVWPSGQPKLYLGHQNAQTKARALMTVPLPDAAKPYSVGDRHCWKDSANKRVYYLTRGAPSGYSVTYADFTAGISGVTFTGPTALTRVGGVDFDMSDSANSAVTDGHPSGRRLVYGMIASTTASDLWMIDVDNLNMYRLTSLSGLTWQSSEPNLAFSYDAANNRMIVVEMAGGEVYTHVFAIPSDPTNAANYTVTRTQLTKASGATVDSNLSVRFFGDRCKLITSLGGLIVLPMQSNKPLVFRPA